MPKPALDRAWRFLRSNMLGLIAIFIALSGVAVALPGKNKIDSGDIKQGQVRTLDLHRGAVTRAKLHRNAVDSSKVGRDSLTGEDIDESTLDPLPLKEGTVGTKEEADRERRIVIPPATLMPQNKGEKEAPQLFVNLGLQQAGFSPSEDNEAAAIFEVPVDRATSSGLQVRLFWSTGGTEGDVTWNVGFQKVPAGAPLKGAQTGGDVTGSSFGSTMVETTVLEIPAATVQNGEPVGLTIARNADAPSDTLSVFARLRLVEIRYTATG